MNKKVDYILIGILSILFTLSTTWDSYSKFSVVNFCIIFMISYLVIYLIWKKLSLVELKLKGKNVILKREYLIYGFIIAVPLIIGLIAYYPGTCTPDTINQWNQVQNNVYNNWHPVMETLFMLKLPSIFYNNIVSATLFQCLLIFLILMYFCLKFRKNFLNFKQMVIVLLLIVCNPLFIRYSVILWKDIIFSWTMFLSTICLINISISNGDWIKKHLNKILFILSSLGLLFFRHNGIVPFVFMFIFLIVFYPKTRKFFIISFIVILVFSRILTGPIFKMANISSKTGGRTEMIGVIMGQLTSYYENNAYFSESEKKILNSVVPLDIIDKNYDPRNFNLIKWKISNFNRRADEKFDDIIKLYITKSIQNPKKFVRSFFNMSSPIWETTSTLSGVDYETTLSSESYGFMKEIKNNVYNDLVKYNNCITNSPLRWLFIGIGQGLFLTIFSIVIVISRSKVNLKKLVPFISVISNSLVMMLLITGKEYRFVYYQSICVMPLLLYSLSSYIYKTKLEK